jgi:hypothetical protein
MGVSCLLENIGIMAKKGTQHRAYSEMLLEATFLSSKGKPTNV